MRYPYVFAEKLHDSELSTNCSAIRIYLRAKPFT